MKMKEIIAVKAKHDSRHKKSKPHKHSKPGKCQTQNQRSTYMLQELEQVRRDMERPNSFDSLTVRGQISGVGKRKHELVDNELRTIGISAPGEQANRFGDDRVHDPLVLSSWQRYSREGTRAPDVLLRDAAWRKGLTRGRSAWQVDVIGTNGFQEAALPRAGCVTVRDWLTQELLLSERLTRCSPDSVTACLECLSRLRGAPHILVMDCRQVSVRQIMQWAFFRCKVVVIIKPLSPPGNRLG